MKYLFILIKSKYFNALFSAYNYSINIEYINKLLKKKNKFILNRLKSIIFYMTDATAD